MIVALLRHGIAEEVNAQTGVSHGLTTGGVARMTAAARGIGRLQLPIELVISCPDPRCRQSAEIVATENHYPIVSDERLRRKADVDRLMDVLLDHWDLPGVLICTHQPDLSEIASELIDGGEVQFKKGSLAVMDLRSVRVHSAKLRALYPPTVLHMLGGWETGNVPQISAPVETPVVPVIDPTPTEAIADAPQVTDEPEAAAAEVAPAIDDAAPRARTPRKKTTTS